MILLLDNYDSFTYNLAQYLGELGCTLEVHRNDKISVDQIALRKPERIVISPGPCTPQEAGISVELIQKLAGRYPILGVCDWGRLRRKNCPRSEIVSWKNE
jgi:anthranilate synthase component 2